MNSRTIVAVMGMVLAIVFSCNARTKSESTPPSSGEIQKLALLVGIDKYKNSGGASGLSNLAGCVNDVMSMKNLVQSKFQFPEENILVLTDNGATHKAIVDSFKSHLIARARPGDIVLFHFSGHGSQMTDISDDEADHLDETLVPYDSRDSAGKYFDISDDIINGLLKALSEKTKNITFVFDACHSGTASRGGGLIRKAPLDHRTPPPETEALALSRNVSEGNNDLRPVDLDYVLISACLEKESAFEYYAEQDEHGALTYFLVNELKKRGSGVTYRDVMDQVKSAVSQQYTNQNPQLEGTLIDQYVFSDSTSLAQTYVLVSPKGSGSSTVKINAGKAEGMSAGSCMEVYAPDTKQFAAPATPIATVEITAVADFQSEGKIISGGPILPRSRAIEVEHRYADVKMGIYYKDLSSSPVMNRIREKLSEFPFIETVAQPTNYRLLIKQDNNAIGVEGPDTTLIGSLVPLSDPEIVAKVVDKIEQWARWYNLLSVDNKTANLNVTLVLKPLHEQSLTAAADVTLPEGTRVQFSVTNNSNKPLYITLLDFASDGSITPIEFVEGTARVMNANSSWTDSLDTTFPEEYEGTVMKDYIKVIASTKPIDARVFTQAAIKGAEDRSAQSNDPLEQLLANATRGLTRTVYKASTGTWTTAQARLTLVRRQ